MDARLLLVVASVAVVITGQPIPDISSQNFVPGVFISAEALKDLQQKAQENSGQGNSVSNQPITNSVNLADNRRTDDLNGEQLKIGSIYQTNPSSQRNVPIESQSQQILPSQPVVGNQRVVTNQPSVLPVQNQPQIINQPTVPEQQQILLSQPNQQNQQAILVSQQPGFNNQKTGFTNQQPIYVSQQPGNQMYMNPQPNQQVILGNGQIAQVVPQSTFVATNPNNQVTLYQNTRPMNPIQNLNQIQNPNAIQNPGTLYAMVPVNGANNVPMPNTNLGNGNTYLVPVQQMPANQIYTVNG